MAVELDCDSVQDNGVLVDNLYLRRIVPYPAFCKSPPVCEVCGVGLRGLRVQIQLVARRRHRSSVALNMDIVAGQWLVFEYDYAVDGQNTIQGWTCIRAIVNGLSEAA